MVGNVRLKRKLTQNSKEARQDSFKRHSSFLTTPGYDKEKHKKLHFLIQ